ncbi:MAG: hypothetical protein P8011_15375 [Acidihalobacter sp.]|jgi:hypothetical protein
MHIEKQDKQGVTVVISGSKASDLLDGLLAHPELGDIAGELVEKLQAAGVQPLPENDHVRYEYAPPLTH